MDKIARRVSPRSEPSRSPGVVVGMIEKLAFVIGVATLAGVMIALVPSAPALMA